MMGLLLSHHAVIMAAVVIIAVTPRDNKVRFSGLGALSGPVALTVAVFVVLVALGAVDLETIEAGLEALGFLPF